MTPRFAIVVHTSSQDDAAVIIQALKGSAKLISVTALPDHLPPEQTGSPRPPLVLTPEPAAPKNNAYAHGIRNKGIKADDLLISALADGAWHEREEITKLFVGRLFAPDSAGPSISNLFRRGVIARDENGRVKLVSQPTPPSPTAS